MNITVQTVLLLNWRRIISAIGTGYSDSKQLHSSIGLLLFAKQMLLGQGLFVFLNC